MVVHQDYCAVLLRDEFSIQMATISECRYRWLRLPATSFVIIPSRPGLTGAVFAATRFGRTARRLNLGQATSRSRIAGISWITQLFATLLPGCQFGPNPFGNFPALLPS